MLSALFRAKYPASVVGAIAASAPLRAFPGQYPPWDSSMYYAVVSRTASAAGGATDACKENIQALWLSMFLDGETPAGRAALSSSFKTCAPLNTSDDVLALAFWIRGNWDVLAMGNYPYASAYMTGGAVELPAFPARAACAHVDAPISPNNKTGLYTAMRGAMSVIANATGGASCFAIDPNPYTHPSFPMDGQWDFQRCTELQPDSFWFAANGVTDSFWAVPYDAGFTTTHCAAAWNVTPSPAFISTAYDLPALRGVSNIVFSNGLFDPWSGASLQASPAPERDLVVVNITGGAHHLDLFFARREDPYSVTEARIIEMAYVRKWIGAAREAHRVQAA